MARIKDPAKSAKKPKTAAKKAKVARDRANLLDTLKLPIGAKKFTKAGDVKYEKLSKKEKATYDAFDLAATEYEKWYDQYLGQIPGSALDKVCWAIQRCLPADVAAKAYSPKVQQNADAPVKSPRGRKSTIDPALSKAGKVEKVRDTVARDRRYAFQGLRQCPLYQTAKYSDRQRIIKEIMIIYNEYFRHFLYHQHRISASDFPGKLFIGEDNYLKTDSAERDGPHLGRNWPLQAENEEADEDSEDDFDDVEDDQGEEENVDDQGEEEIVDDQFANDSNIESNDGEGEHGEDEKADSEFAKDQNVENNDGEGEHGKEEGVGSEFAKGQIVEKIPSEGEQGKEEKVGSEFANDRIVEKNPGDGMKGSELLPGEKVGSEFANDQIVEKNPGDGMKGSELLPGENTERLGELAAAEQAVVDGGFSPLANPTLEELAIAHQAAETVETDTTPGAGVTSEPNVQ